MTHSLKVLEGRNFATTEPNPEDARGKLVFITDEGRAFRERAMQAVGERFAGLLEAEHFDLMDRVRDDLKTMRAHLDQNRP